jgi:two-component system, cell cycle sensor histidine kinase and response regulator CckA
MSVEFFDLVTSLYQDKGTAEARDVANNLLFDIAHAIGKADARSFHAKMGVTDPIDKLSAGPIHFSFSGWAFVKILPESRPSPDANYFLIYDHPFSFEADAWLKRRRQIDFPVCIMSSGYSSGWCEESFGIPLVAVEVQCIAKGDPQCRFIMAPPSRIEEHLTREAKSTNQATVSGRNVMSVTVPEFFQRKRLEDALRRSHDLLEDRVRERTSEVVRAYEQLKRETAERKRIEEELRQAQKMEALGRLAGGVAHDFNNALGVILGYSELLARELADNPASSGRVEAIKSACESAASLTAQLLTFSRRQVLQPKVLNLNSTVSDTHDMLQRLMRENVEAHLVLDSKLGHVKADPGQMVQVIMNLAVNACDAMPNGGKLTIETGNTVSGEDALPNGVRSGRYVMLAVSDTGTGMNAETQARIFEPFFTTKAAAKGTGLGLATVYGIVEQSGGYIFVDSKPGEGTTFKIYLPQVDDPVEPALLPKVSAQLPQGSETILLVEDEATLRNLVCESLQASGYTVLIASNGVEALKVIEQHKGPIDLLITDVIMPQMSGPELVQWLAPRRPEIKVLYMSGYTDDKLHGVQRSEPEMSLLQKPFHLEDLAQKLRDIFARNPAPPNSHL